MDVMLVAAPLRFFLVTFVGEGLLPALSFLRLESHGGTATSSSAGRTVEESALVWSLSPLSFSDSLLPPGESGDVGDSGASPDLLLRPPGDCKRGTDWFLLLIGDPDCAG